MFKVEYVFGAFFFTMGFYSCNALTCHECEKDMQEAFDYIGSQSISRTSNGYDIDIPHYCLGPNDLGKLKTCMKGDVCTKYTIDKSGDKIHARFCKSDASEGQVGKCVIIDLDEVGVKVCLNMLVHFCTKDFKLLRTIITLF